VTVTRVKQCMCTRRFTFILDFTERSDAAVAAMPLGRAEAAGRVNRAAWRDAEEQAATAS
jgi:lipid-binding SYLF domain-containing protein